MLGTKLGFKCWPVEFGFVARFSSRMFGSRFVCWRNALDVGVAVQLLAWRFSVVDVALQLLAWRFSCWCGQRCGALDVGVAPAIAANNTNFKFKG